MSSLHGIWLVIWLVNVEVCSSSGKLRIRFVNFQNNKRVKNGDCCDNVWTCSDACDIFLEICATEVSRSNCNADKFRSKVLGVGPRFTFPGIGGDLGNGRENPLEYTFQKWQGFTLAIEIWDHDDDIFKGSNDFVDNVHLDINDAPEQNSTSASNKAKRMASKSSPSERYIDVEISIYCDDNFLLPDCARRCISRDDAQGHYTCDYVRGRVVCNQHWYGDNCTQYCRPRNDSLAHYTCDNFGTKICARDWFGPNCSTFCKSRDDLTGHYNCDALTGDKVCLTHWYGTDCLVFCKDQDSSGGHYSCNKTNGGKVCLQEWYGTRCTKYCQPQNDLLLGHFTCDVNGDKICLAGWHGDSCTQEILPSAWTRSLTVIQSSHDSQTHPVPRNSDTPTQSTTSRERKSPHFRETTSNTSPITSSTWNTIHLHPPSNISPESLRLTNTHTTILLVPSTARISKQFSTTNEMHSVTNKASSTNHKTLTFNKTDLKRSTLSSSIKTQSLSGKNEFTWNSEPKTSIALLTETLKAENPSKTAQAYLSTEIKAQSSLALISSSHSKTERNSQSKSIIENGMTRTFTTRNVILPSKTQQTSAEVTTYSSISSQTLKDTSPHNRSVTNPTSSFMTETTFPGRTEVSSTGSKATQTLTKAGMSNPSVSQMRPVVTMSSSIQVLLTGSFVVTSPSSTIEMDGGKVLKKKHSFTVVFFPIVVFMMVVGVGVCIKIKRSKLISRKVAPLHGHLRSQTKTSSRVLKISHNQSQQELLKMDVLSRKGK